MKKIILKLIIWFFVFFWFVNNGFATDVLLWNWQYLRIDKELWKIERFNNDFSVLHDTFNTNNVIDSYVIKFNINSWYIAIFTWWNTFVEYVEIIYDNHIDTNYKNKLVLRLNGSISWLWTVYNNDFWNLSFDFENWSDKKVHYTSYDGIYYFSLWGWYVSSEYSYELFNSDYYFWNDRIELSLWWQSSSNQVCKAIMKKVWVLKSFNYDLAIDNDLEEYKIFSENIINDWNSEVNGWYFEFWLDEEKFLYQLVNTEGLYWFTWAIYNKFTSSIVFDSLENPFTDSPILQVSSSSYTNYIDYFELKNSWNNLWYEKKVIWKTFNWEMVEVLSDILWNDYNFEFNKWYNLWRTDLTSLYFVFWKHYNDIDLKIEFWKIYYETKIFETCVNAESWEITVGGETYTWTIDEIGDNWLITNNTISDINYGDSSFNATKDISIWFDEGSCTGLQYEGIFGWISKAVCYTKNFFNKIFNAFKWVYEWFWNLIKSFDVWDIEHKIPDFSFNLINTTYAGDEEHKIMSIISTWNFDNNSFLTFLFWILKYVLLFITFLTIYFTLYHNNSNNSNNSNK